MIELRAWALISAIRSSIPMVNIKRISPNWLKSSILTMLSSGKSHAERSGATIPKRLGPNRIPAIISPITVGCPSRAKSHPTPRATDRITTIWSNKRPIVVATWCCTPSPKAVKAPRNPPEVEPANSPEDRIGVATAAVAQIAPTKRSKSTK